MAIWAYLRAVLWQDLPARMTGPLSLVLLLVPLIAPDFTAQHLRGSTLVWIVAFLCLIISTSRAWLSERRARLAEKLAPLIEDLRQLRELWDKIQYDYRDSKDSRFISFPLSGFDVEKWEEVHKQLLRLLFWTSLQANQTEQRFRDLGIAERPRLYDLMYDQGARRSLNALGYTKLLEEHAALLTRHRTRIAG
jgi:hypothetical protein